MTRHVLEFPKEPRLPQACLPRKEQLLSTAGSGSIEHKELTKKLRSGAAPQASGVGAAPGGWSQVCLEHGAELV